jgi:hypothetical protein
LRPPTNDLAALRREIEHLRSLLAYISDPRTVAAIQDMIRELESRAQALGDGDAIGT